MKKTTLMYECDKETHNSTIKAEGDLLEIIAGAGADMAIRICNTVVNMLGEEKEG